MPKRRLTQADARRIALALPEAKEGAHMRMVAMKIAPENLDALVRSDPDTFKDVWGLLGDAWELTAPKRRVKPRR